MRRFSCPLALVLLSASPLAAQGHSTSGRSQAPAWNEDAKLLAGDGSQSHQFGGSVSIDGNTAVVGAVSADGLRVQSGAAYVFERIGGAWVERQKIFASDGELGDQFGFSLAMEGDRIVVGARGRGRSGAAYVFRREASSWVEEAILRTATPELVFSFGTSVAISGNTIVIGAPSSRHVQPSSNVCASGSAHLFERSEGVWFEKLTLLPSDLECWDSFGTSVAVDGRTALVGAIFGGTTIDSGAVYVFHRGATEWSVWQKLTASAPAVGANFGDAVSLSGSVALIGAPRDDTACPTNPSCESGAAYVFRNIDEIWVEEQKLLASDQAQLDFFGSILSISGDLAVVGALGSDGLAPDAGAAYIYTRGVSSWREEQKLVASDGASGDAFGIVSVSGNTVLSGAFQDDDNGQSSGSAYVFERLTATSSLRNAGSNPASYTATAPVLGSSWDANVDLTTTGHTHARVIGYLAAATAPLVGGQVLLVGGTNVFALPLQPGPSASWSVPIPNDPALAGLTVYTQAVHLLGVTPFALSNAQDLFLGY